MAAVAREAGVDALVKMSQMAVSQMSSPSTTPSPQQRQHWLSEQALLGTPRCANRIGRVEFFPAPVSERLQLVRCSYEGGGQASARACETIWSTIMAKFLFIYRQSTESRAQPSPEEMQALQAAWYTWMQKFSSAIVGGDGLKPSGRL